MIESLLRVELHMHTRFSKDSLVRIPRLLEHCKKIGLDRIAITDHNSIDGALRAKQLAPDQVIVGEEIETTQGELLGYFLEEWVPPGLEPLDAIRRLKAQGAVISLAHPFDTTRSQHWSKESLTAILPHIDAIETFNARCLTNVPNQNAAIFARKNALLETVGSDAHSLWEVGRATMQMSMFNDAASFRESLKTALQFTRLSPAVVHLFSRYAVFYKKLN